MDEHTPGLKRHLSDTELRTHTVTELMDLAGDCDIEPADPAICDACAAYLIAQEKKEDPQVEDFRDLIKEAAAKEYPAPSWPLENQPEAEWAGGAAIAADWMARALTAEAAVAELLVDKEATEAMIERLNIKVGEATIAVARFAEKPWLFLPGDRVIALLGNKMEGGTVRQIRIPGPIRDENVVQVELDEVPFHGLDNKLWFNPDQVERLG